MCKHTHERTIGLAPPLVVDESEVDFALEALSLELEAPQSRALQVH